MSAWDYFIIVLLFYSLLLRLSHLSHHFLATDLQRDYLVGRHIVYFKDFPSIGPNNSVLGAQTILPIPYYLAAGLLLVNDSFITLNIANIFFQIAGILLIYLIGTKLFSKATGFIAATLFSFSNVALHQSTFYYQPFVAQTLLFLCYFLLSMYFAKGNFKFLYSGLFFYILAVAFHSSAIAILPIIIAMLYLIARKHKKTLKDLAPVYFCLILFLLLIHLPLLRTLGTAAGRTGGQNREVSTLREFGTNLKSNTEYFVGSFFIFYKSVGGDIAVNRSYSPLSGFDPKPLVALTITIVLGIIYFLPSNRTTEPKKFEVVILMSMVVVTLIAISMLKIPQLAFFHFVPISAPFVLIVSEFIVGVSPKTLPGKIILVLFVISLIQIFSYKPGNLKLNLKSVGRTNDTNLPIHSVINSIKGSAIELKKQQGLPDFRFFDVRKFITWPSFQSDAYIWNKLEIDLNTQFIRVAKVNDYPGFVPINDNKYLFIVCSQADLTFCLSDFHKEFASYEIEKQTYNDNSYAVFLTKRHNP